MALPAETTASSAPIAARPSADAPQVLVVEDEPGMQKLLGILLKGDGLRVLEAASAEEALLRAAEANPDLVLLDLGLPDSDGVEVTRTLREWMAAPILILSARGGEQDKVAALEAGANDYLTKPFANRELLARIHVLLRPCVRAAAQGDQSVIELGELFIDFGKRLVRVAGREIHLTPTEYKLFGLFMRNPGRVLTHDQLLKFAWGPRFANQAQYLRVYLGHLRRKLERDPSRPRYLLTEPGVGYRLQVE